MIISSDRIQAMTEAARAQASSLRQIKDRMSKVVDRDSATPAQRLARRTALLADLQDGAAADRQLERIISGNDLVSVNYLAIGMARSRAVCRVHVRDGSQKTVGFGTGFLVAPGVIMTNHHVIGGADEVGASLAEFEYELDVNGKEKAAARFQILANPAPITNKPLDFCLAMVAPVSETGRKIESFGSMPLNPTPGKAIVGEYLTIIQHPAGERKQVCVRENKLLKYDENGTTLWYATDTLAGSSGSPITNGLWQVVGLHHMGVPDTDPKTGKWLTVDGKVWDRSMDESQVRWIANEGIRISAIMRHLKEEHANNVIVRKVMAGMFAPPVNEAADGHSGGSTTVTSDGEMCITVPVSIRVSVGSVLGNAGVMSGSASTGAVAAGDAGASGITASAARGDQVGDVEAVVIDQSNYGERPGYNPNFLGTGKLALPMPVAPARDLLVFSSGSKKLSQLNYWTYSVLMSKTRRMALVSATNVDTSRRNNEDERADDSWFFDSRIPKSAQVGPEFYKKQKLFETDRDDNPFDRGHLCKRVDCQWGDSRAEAKRNGDDSFHWTNCTPQHHLFNQGSKQWRGLEDFATDLFAAATGRCCVFNGPIFDAPVSRMDKNGQRVVSLRGARQADPTFGEVKIPKLFFKIVACVDEAGKPKASAYIMSQEEFLDRVERLKGWKKRPAGADEVLSEAEARKFKVRVKDIEGLTGLNFGGLRNWPGGS
jgi:endonuclease G, mitochondrial